MTQVDLKPTKNLECCLRDQGIDLKGRLTECLTRPMFSEIVVEDVAKSRVYNTISYILFTLSTIWICSYQHHGPVIDETLHNISLVIMILICVLHPSAHTAA